MTQTRSDLLQKLDVLRHHGGAIRTRGLDDATIERFAASHPELREAIDAAAEQFAALCADPQWRELLAMDEQAQLDAVQAGFVNFYPDDAVNPYVALTGRGPWIVTLKGAVVHDSGGYGMLPFGHAPKAVLEAMARPQAMANIMTPSLSQLRLVRALQAEIGHSRGGSPYSHILCLNSGSESVSLAGRIADVNTKLMTDAGGRHAGKQVKRLAVKGAFHGRTELPAIYSDSSRKAYQTHLASFRHEGSLLTVEPYSIEQLRAVFGGRIPSASLYAKQSFVQNNPNTVQALANAMVRALRWLSQATTEQIVAAVPPEYTLGDRTSYVAALERLRPVYSRDGRIAPEGVTLVHRMVAVHDPSVKAASGLDESATYTNAFVDKARPR